MRFFLLVISLCVLQVPTYAQDEVFTVLPEQENQGYYKLPNIDQWKYREGHDPQWSEKDLDDRNWHQLDSAEIYSLTLNEDGVFECWFRFKFQFDSSFVDHPFFLLSTNSAAQEIFLDGELKLVLGNLEVDNFRRNMAIPHFLSLTIGQEYSVAIHFRDEIGPLTQSTVPTGVLGLRSFLWFMDAEAEAQREIRADRSMYYTAFVTIILMALFLWTIWLLNRDQNHLLYIASITTLMAIFPLITYLNQIPLEVTFLNREWNAIREMLPTALLVGVMIQLPVLLAKIFNLKVPLWLKIYNVALFVLLFPLFWFTNSDWIPNFASITIVLICGFFVYQARGSVRGSKKVVVAGLLLTVFLLVIPAVLFSIYPSLSSQVNVILVFSSVITFPASLLIYVAVWLRESIQNERLKAKEVIQVTNEKQELLAHQNTVLEEQVHTRTKELSQSLDNLKATQTQLIQSEKMASLGELTAGIAHEIQNPLNFVNNFSEVNGELIKEIQEERHKTKDNRDEGLENVLLKDIGENQDKIIHHGQRASSIVKGMLEHSRTGDGTKEPTDINALADEYLRLAYHGLRAKDSSFQAEFQAEFDPDLPKINVVPQDIGRVLLNLINNAFHAVNERAKHESENYKPLVTVATSISPSGGGKGEEKVLIQVSDNGPGIPEDIKDKIFQPFFTTKATGEGTGLGLSLSYDIITKGHGGSIAVTSGKEQGTVFTIQLPISS